MCAFCTQKFEQSKQTLILTHGEYRIWAASFTIVFFQSLPRDSNHDQSLDWNRSCSLIAKPRKKSPCYSVYKTYKSLFCELFGQIYKDFHQRKLPTIIIYEYISTCIHVYSMGVYNNSSYMDGTLSHAHKPYTIVKQNILWTKICPAWLGHCHRGSGQSLLG